MKAALTAALTAAGLLPATGALPAPEFAPEFASEFAPESASAPAQQEQRPMTLVQAQDDGHTVTIRVDDVLRIELPENATTGYRWAVDRVDAAHVDTLAIEPRYAGNAVGSGGTVAFLFQGRKPGTSQVSLKQWRHWEGDASVIARFGITLQIQPAAAASPGNR